MRIYLASPLGFADSTRAYAVTITRGLADPRIVVCDPWDTPWIADAFAETASIVDPATRLAAEDALDRRVAQSNLALLESCDTLVAVCDGVDVDSGTAWEMGYAYGRGMRVFALRTDVRRTGENEACGVNLQVWYGVVARGGVLARNLFDLRAAVLGALDATADGG
jgi:nucleoside 2-deoxyribosyltransferase